MPKFKIETLHKIWKFRYMVYYMSVNQTDNISFDIRYEIYFNTKLNSLEK